MPASPPENIHPSDSYREGYINVISDVRDRCMSLKTDNDITIFKQKYVIRIAAADIGADTTENQTHSTALQINSGEQSAYKATFLTLTER